MLSGTEGDNTVFQVAEWLKRKPLRQKRAWVGGQELCAPEEQEMWLERLGWGHIIQGLVSLGKEFGFCYICTGIAILRSVLWITLPMRGF